MDFINNIKTNSLIICEEYVKKIILKANKLLPIKIMNMHEFRNKFYFTYDESAILYLTKKYNMKYEVAKNYLENLYYVELKEYSIPKLDYLVTLKKELISENLLKYNNNFKEYLKRVNIILYNQIIDDFTTNMLKGLNYVVIDRKYHQYSHNILEFDTMEEEIHYVANAISKLLDSGINIERIKLTNVTEEYYNTIERILSMYNLKVAINYQIPLTNYSLIKDFIKYYQELDLEDALNKITIDNEIAYNELIKIINKYYQYNSKELLIYKIEHSYISSDKYTNSIEIIDYLEYESNESEFIFMIGFNEGIVPKYQSDTSYITDNIVNKVGLNNTKTLNKLLEDKTLKAINDIKNLTITYKLRDYTSSYYPSVLISNFKVIKEKIDYDISYSEIYDKLTLAKLYDDYFKYGSTNERLDILNNNYEIKYNSYSHKYTGIKRTMDKLNLSYSKMQIYNKCAFRYYLTDILKLDIFKENFSTIIGSMVHYVLEKCLSNNDNDIDKYANEFLEGKSFTKKESFFLNKYKEAISELLKQIILEKEYSQFDESLYEKKIDIDYGNNIHFTGIIDKILYHIDNDTTYVSLIDYKTGDSDISLKYLDYGINIQLPIYLYLSTKLDLNNIKYSGFYLQSLNIQDKDYRLYGYSNSNKDILKIMDKNYNNTKIIKGLKVNNDGNFSKTSKVLSDEELEKIKSIVSDQIDKVIANIKNNHFEINPKVTEGKNIGCEYCKYKDICFSDKFDEVTIEPKEFGGEI